MPDEQDKPDWWKENEKLREELNLPEYQPPRFEDGIYTHEVISDLEEQLDAEIQLSGIETRYPDDWTVRVDGESVLTLPRHRDDSGNTVYEMAASEFREAITHALR